MPEKRNTFAALREQVEDALVKLAGACHTCHYATMRSKSCRECKYVKETLEKILTASATFAQF